MNDDVQRLVRKLQPVGPRSFDEQMWPIYVSILVLGCYLVGVVLSMFPLDEPRMFGNGLTWLGIVTLATGAALWSMRYVRSNMLKRTLVFSLLLSLIVNLSLLVAMAWTTIFHSFWDKDRPEAITKRPQPDVVIPEYPIYNEEKEQRIRHEVDKPVETGEASAEQRIELTRQSVVTESNEALPSPEADRLPEMATTRPTRADVPSAPRASETLASLSRQQRRTELRVSTSPSQPFEPRATVDTASSESLPQSTNVATAKQKSPVQAEETPAEPEASTQVRRVQLARRSENDSESPTTAASVTLPKQLNRPLAVPRAATPLGAVVTSTLARDEPELEPNTTLMQKRVTAAPEQTKTIELAPQVAVNVERARLNEVTGPESPQWNGSITRSPLNSQAASDVSVDAEQLGPSQVTPAEPNSAAATAAKLANSPSDSAAESREGAEVAESIVAPAMKIARVVTDTSPSLAESLEENTSTARAPRQDTLRTSTSAEVVSIADSPAETELPTAEAQPSRMAMARSTVGSAGVGQSSNLESGAAAPDTPVNISSVSANRSRAAQDIDPGPSLSPSARVVQRQMRARDEAPRTPVTVNSENSSMVAGTAVPAAEASTASATQSLAHSNAQADDFTADRGTAELDLGPTKIAADTGSGRAEGGGQPEVSLGQLPRALSRSNATAAASSLPTSTTAPAPTAPAALDQSPSGSAIATGTAISRLQGPAGESGNAGPTSQDEYESESAQVAKMTGERAAAGESQLPEVTAGGGNASPGRQARSLRLPAETALEIPSLAGVAESGGEEQGLPIDASGAQPERFATGLKVLRSEEWGALSGATAIDALATPTPLPAIAKRTESTADQGDGPAVDAVHEGAPRRNRKSTWVGGPTDVKLDPEEFAINVAPGSDDGLAGQNGELSGDSQLQSGGSLLVEVEAPEAAGGLGDVPAVDVGLRSRQAQDESELVSLQSARFLRRSHYSPPKMSPRKPIVSSTRAFQRRIMRHGEELAGERGLPSPKTEVAIELGLVFLSRFQSSDGSWSLNNFAVGKAELPATEEANMVSDTAATGLSLLAFLGAGYHHRDDKYQEVVATGLRFLVSHQNEDGDLYIDLDDNSTRSAWLYSHGIATLALCEAYGMTQDPELKEPAQKAIDFIVAAQHPTRGGWRYSPTYGADSSVTGWMTMALKSGELADLEVPKDTYDKINQWLDLAQASAEIPYLFRYNPYAPDTDQQRHGRNPTRAMTAVGLLMRMYTGWKRDDPAMLNGARTLLQNLPDIGTSRSPKRDTYYWYYATQVMFHMGGDYWEQWNRKLHPLLTDTQLREGPLAGSWDPQTPIPDRWSIHAGRIYVTTMNLLSLEVFYRHMPLYEDTRK